MSAFAQLFLLALVANTSLYHSEHPQKHLDSFSVFISIHLFLLLYN